MGQFGELVSNGAIALLVLIATVAVAVFFRPPII